MSVAAFPHYCTDPDVTWGNGRGHWGFYPPNLDTEMGTLPLPSA